MGFKLRTYQKEGIDEGLKYLSKTSKQRPTIIVAPVAAGKSLYIAKIAEKYNKPLLVLQPSIELLYQNYNKLKFFGGNATIYSASAGIKEISHLTYATLGSVKKIGKKFKEIGVDTLLIDECHMSYSPKKGSMFRKFLEDLNPKKIIGFTATPIRLNTYGDIDRTYSQLDFLMKGRKGAPAIFKDIIHLTQVKEMVDNKFWAKLNYELYDFDESTLTLNSTGAEYSQTSIQQAIVDNGVNNNIYLRVKSLINKQNAKSILVFVDGVDTAKTLVKHIPYTAVVYGGMNKTEREDIIDKFKTGEIKAVFNYGTLTAGFDYPELQYIILGRPTNSFALYYQMIGRVTRNPEYPNQKEGYVIDFCNNVKRFGKLETIEYEYINGYGWGLFNNNKLLTQHPMDLPPLTKEELLLKVNNKLQDKKDLKIWFGKYKGKRVSEIPISYLKFIFENFEFNGTKMKQLETQLKKIINK